MSEANIQVLSSQLASLGFTKSFESALSTAICFKPERFELRDIEKEAHSTIIVAVQFQAMENDVYAMPYYDVTLRKAVVFSNDLVNGINALALDQDMEAIDWLGQMSGKFIRTDMSLPSIEKSHAILSVMQKLQQMEKYNARDTANLLRYKHWVDTPHESLIPSLAFLKGQFEVSQRFYFFDGEQPISKGEAVRFLNSRWVEKQMLAKKKAASGNAEIDAIEKANEKTRGSGLLSKKKKIPRKKITRS